jgi:acetyl-CoA synthetase
VLVITADEQVRGGGAPPLKAIVDEALAGSATVRDVIVYRRTGGVDLVAPRDKWLHELLEGTDQLRARWVGAEHPAVPALHLGLHRQAQGCSTRPAATCCVPRSP